MRTKLRNKTKKRCYAANLLEGLRNGKLEDMSAELDIIPHVGVFECNRQIIDLIRENV